MLKTYKPETHNNCHFGIKLTPEFDAKFITDITCRDKLEKGLMQVVRQYIFKIFP
jgi:hypothetical protein